jgi:alkylation response protein AidB-like acyl-CoA dehydrogenase
MSASIEAAGRMADSAADEMRETRRLPDDVAEALLATGLFRAAVPTAYGGDEVALLDILDAIEEASYWDGSFGWCAMIGATTSLLSGFLPERWAQEIYGDERSWTGGYAAPVGTATMVDGGLQVSGRWSWGSGTRHCTWIGGGVRLVDDDGHATRRDDGLAAPYVFFDRADVELIDNWDVMGLHGSGSGDYTVADGFVPEGRWAVLGGAPPLATGPLYRVPFLGALALGVASVSLGLARRSVDELVALAAGKRPALSSRTLAERPVVQADVAMAEAAFESARSFVRHEVGAAWEAASAGHDFSDEQKRRIRLAATNASLRATEAVDLMYNAAGGSSVFRSSPLERVFRDAHVATQHAMIAPRLYEPIGRMRLGLPTDTSGF